MRRVRVQLSTEHCVACASWLREIYLPYMVEASRRSGGMSHFGFALRLIPLFSKMGRRKIRENRAVREIDWELAAWFGALPACAVLGQAPAGPRRLLHDFEAETIFQLEPDQARMVLLTGIAWEAAAACDEAAWRCRGRPRKERTLEDVKALKSYGGDDEGRAMRRLVQRASQSEGYYRGLAALLERAGVAVNGGHWRTANTKFPI